MDLQTLLPALVLVVLLGLARAQQTSLGCSQVDPSTPHNQDLPFKLEVDKTQYSKNEPVQVTLKAIGSSSIKELAIASYSLSGDQTISSGSFVAETAEFETQSCGATEDDLNMLRTPSELEWERWDVQGMWIPPADQHRGSYVVFFAAVRDSSGTLVTGIRSPGVWRSEKDDEKTTISCRQVSPMDEVFPQPQQYRLHVSSMMYSPGSTIRVTLTQMPSRPVRPFTKFMISAFDPFHERVESKFLASPLVAEPDVWCEGEANATVRQADDDMKENVTVEWRPVHTPNMVKFFATVVDFGDGRRHTGIASVPVYVTWDNQTIQARNPYLDCSLATEENVNTTKVPYELSVLDYEGKTTDMMDSNLPLTVMLKSDATTVFTNYLVRAFDESGFTIGSFSASKESPSAISGTCGMEVGDMTIVKRMSRASWVWVPPAQYTGNVKFIVAVHNFFTRQHYVLSSGWIYGQSVSSSEVTCAMATPHVETFPDSGSFKLYASKSSYKPGDEIPVTLLSYDTYSAYIVRVFDHKLRPVGSLRPHEGSPSPSVGKVCEVQGDAIVNENDGMKKNATFWWKVPPDTPQSVMFVAAALHSSGRLYLGIGTWLNLTSDPSLLLPCPSPLPAEAGTSDRYEFTMMDLAGNRRNLYYDANEPLFVHFSGKAGSVNTFLNARILASTALQRTYGTFISPRDNSKMRSGQCENANDTVVTYWSYPRFNVSTVWVAPAGDDQGVRFLALVMDDDGLMHEVYSPWFNKQSIQSPPVPVCRQVEPHVPVFPRASRCELTAGLYDESGKFLMAQTYTKDVDVQVYLRCPDDVSVTHYKLRAFDHSDYWAKSVGAFRWNQGMLQGVPYNVTTCTTKDDSAEASQLVKSGFVGTWRPASDYLPRKVRFYAAYTGSDSAYPRLFMGLQSQLLYLEHQTNATTPNTTVPDTYFNVSCTDLTYDENGDRKYWLTVRNEKSAWTNASLYHMNSPLFVELMIPGRNFHAFRIGVRDEMGGSQGYFQSLSRYPGNWFSVRQEWCSQGPTATNDGRFYGRNITLMWTPGNTNYAVTFYAAVIDENSDLVQNIISQQISPRLSSVGVTFECSETTPSSEPFRDWRAYGLKAWLSGIENGRKKVEVHLAYYNGTFDGFMIRAFDQDDRPVTEFKEIFLNGTRFEPYYCGQSADTILVKKSPSHLISATVEFLAPAYVKGVRFVATVSNANNKLLIKGIVSDWVNVSQSLESLQGLGCNDVTPYMMTSPENPPFELVLQTILHLSESTIQMVTLNLFNTNYTSRIKAYTIRAFSHGGSIGMFFSKTSDVGWSGTAYNATTRTCDLRNDTLTNANDWPRRQNMSILWEAPVGAAQVQFVATIVNTDGDVFRGVKSKWINLAQTCAPAKCAQQKVQRTLCNMTSSWVNPTVSDYVIFPNATEFGTGDVITVKVASYADGNKMQGVMMRAFSDEGRPVGRFIQKHVHTAPTSCQSPGDAVWNETDSMYENSAGSDWLAPHDMDHDVMYIYFVAYVYNGQYWTHAKRSPRIYVRDDRALNGTRNSFYTWCNITSLYTPSNPSGYKIRVPDTFEDGKPIEVEIDSYMTKEMLGFMVRAYDPSGRSVGQFSESPYSAIQPKLYSCHATHDAFTNNTASMFIYSREASWKNNGENVKAVTFVATVLSSDGTLHTGIRSETVHLKGGISTGPQEKLSCANTSVLVAPPANPKFYLDANATEFTVQLPLYVTLRTKGPRFSGFFVRAFCSEYQPCGIFSHSYVYSLYHGKAVKCASHQGDSITNSSTDFRFSQTVMWISPPSPPSMVIFVASIVDEHGRLTNSIRSDWIMRSGGSGVRTTPAPPHDVFCSDTEPYVKTDPPYPPFVIEAANMTFANSKTIHIQIKSYGSTQIHWYFIRAFDRMGRSVGTFDTYTWSSVYGSSVNYVHGDLVTCDKPSDSIMSDLSASPRQSLVMKFTAPVRDTPDEVMFIAIIRDSAGMTYKAVQSKYIPVDGRISAATTKASSVIMVTFLTLLTLFLRHRP